MTEKAVPPRPIIQRNTYAVPEVGSGFKMGPLLTLAGHESKEKMVLLLSIYLTDIIVQFSVWSVWFWWPRIPRREMCVY